MSCFASSLASSSRAHQQQAKGLPQAIVDKLNNDINRIVNDPKFAQRIAADGLIPAGGPPERLLKLLNEEIANWAKVAERAGLKVP